MIFLATNSMNLLGKHRLQSLYVISSGIISLVLPPEYMLQGMFRGYKGVSGTQGSCNKSFVLLVRFSWTEWLSMPVFVFVPVFCNSRRIFTGIGRALAAINMAFFCFNCLGLYCLFSS
ncbi:unnamed protein product [Coffea canephora]|uniref:DUF7733 domain-containing protein n=1 Tax=Coffea canephora TaxID=49390 RepID=A0A068V756_COFCA|nr:unnamed protein product [Coffea canephora]